MLTAARAVLKEVGAQSIEAIGITNQRETTLVWERATAKPLANAIVWQDRRTAMLCDELKREGWDAHVAETTGLVIDPYFSATKLAWLLANVPGLAERARAGEICFGTVDSFLLFKLTGGKTACDRREQRRPHHALRHQVRALGRAAARPARHSSRAASRGPRQPGRFRRDGERAFRRGDPDQGRCRRPAGRGLRSGLLHARHVESDVWHRLLRARQYRRGEGGFDHAHARDRLLSARRSAHVTRLEGSIFMAGATVQWLRDSLGLIAAAAESEALAHRADPKSRVYLVPAFQGLGAPHLGRRGARPRSSA